MPAVYYILFSNCVKLSCFVQNFLNPFNFDFTIWSQIKLNFHPPSFSFSANDQFSLKCNEMYCFSNNCKIFNHCIGIFFTNWLWLVCIPRGVTETLCENCLKLDLLSFEIKMSFFEKMEYKTNQSDFYIALQNRHLPE